MTPIRKPLKNPTLWIALGILLVGGVVSTLAVRNLMQSRQAAREEAAQPPPQRVSVSALGRIEPKGGIIDVAASDGGVLSQLLIDEGDRVTEGQVLAYLDIYEVRKAERDYAESQLIEARNKLDAESQVGTARIQEANTRIGKAEAPMTAAIQAQAATVASLKSQLNLAQLDLDRIQGLYNQGAVSRQEFDRQQTEVTRLQRDIASAEASLARLEADQTADLDTASAQVTAAEADRQLARVEAGVASAERNLALAEAKLALATVTAPTSGQIIETILEPGEALSTQQPEPLLVMGNTDEMVVIAEVYETDVGLVETGQTVTIVSRNGAFEETLTGTVEKVGLQIAKNDVLDDDPAANADARVAEVTIAVDQDDAVSGLTNLQVDVLIDVDVVAKASEK
ncbi:MAG: efflux RND transporter periplasmic adaptor subunit [Cyanobacteria bacterium P01_A01_bin.114]